MVASRPLEIALVLASVALLLGTLIAVPVYLVRIPADHFVRPPRRRSLAARILRNVLGVAVIAVGLAMLVLPGQGLITVLIGLSLLDVPIKRRAIRKLLSNERAIFAIDRLRRKHGRESLQLPHGDADSGPRYA